MCLIFSKYFSTKRADFPNAALDSAEAISNSCLSCSSLEAILMPLPPPPNADFSNTGYSASAAIFRASSTSFTVPSLPGTVGTLALFIIFLHFILSPVNSMALLLGPINMIFSFSHLSAKPSFSDKNPYPG